MYLLTLPTQTVKKTIFLLIKVYLFRLSYPTREKIPVICPHLKHFYLFLLNRFLLTVK